MKHTTVLIISALLTSLCCTPGYMVSYHDNTLIRGPHLTGIDPGIPCRKGHVHLSVFAQFAADDPRPIAYNRDTTYANEYGLPDTLHLRSRTYETTGSAGGEASFGVADHAAIGLRGNLFWGARLPAAAGHADLGASTIGDMAFFARFTGTWGVATFGYRPEIRLCRYAGNRTVTSDTTVLSDETFHTLYISGAHTLFVRVTPAAGFSLFGGAQLSYSPYALLDKNELLDPNGNLLWEFVAGVYAGLDLALVNTVHLQPCVTIPLFASTSARPSPISIGAMITLAL